ncbi:MAG: hypothetical protein KatS3mg088_770 [Patescibacteria group bacterium]|nr:MAG: hypothetical protein KatS3mg088_770 [Patescibacteria group bacterium]
MAKRKVVLEIEVDETKISPGWEKYLEEFFKNLDNSIMPIGNEARKEIKIKKIEIKKSDKLI